MRRGVHLTHPFQDPRVVALGLGVQARVRPQPGRMKPVLAEATAGLLPPEILHRRAKGCFDEIYYRGLARNLRRLEAMVRSAPIDGLGVFDKGELLRHLEEASLGGPSARELAGFERALDAIKWLAMQDEWHRSAPTPAAVLRWGTPVAAAA
jgi:asparagine synthase (glutamine-hydrolysing)